MRLTKMREINFFIDDFNLKNEAGKSDTEIRVYGNSERNNRESRMELF